MNLHLLARIFNRALSLTFGYKKLLLVFCVLALSGMLVVFFRGVAWHANHWVQLSMTFLPIFLCASILLSLGILLIRIYHNEVKNRPVNYLSILTKSWELIIGASYFFIPIILTYLLLWMGLGLFFLLKEIPVVGDFFSAVLAFAPFLINLGALVLCVISVLMLFFLTPIMALRGIDRSMVFQSFVKRIEKDAFSNIVLVLMGFLPLLFVLTLLILAAILTDSICGDGQTLPQITLKWFFMMIPFTAFLTPAVIFFFNFAAEAHVSLNKNL